MIQSPVFFVCGTPSNRRGFEYVTDTGVKLPGEPSKYLDIFDVHTMSAGRTYVCRDVLAGTRNYSAVTVYEKINPNDENSNRGAFIAAGFLICDAASLDDLLAWFCRLTEILGQLAGLRSRGNAFPGTFLLAEFVFRQPRVQPPFVDFLEAQAQNAGGLPDRQSKSLSLFFNDASGARRGKVEHHYFSELNHAVTIRNLELELRQTRQTLEKQRLEALAELQASEKVVNELKRQLAHMGAIQSTRHTASGAERPLSPFSEAWGGEVTGKAQRSLSKDHSAAYIRTQTRSRTATSRGGGRQAAPRQTKRLYVVPERLLNYSLVGLTALLCFVVIIAIGFKVLELWPAQNTKQEPPGQQRETLSRSPAGENTGSGFEKMDASAEHSEELRAILQQRSGL